MLTTRDQSYALTMLQSVYNGDPNSNVMPCGGYIRVCLSDDKKYAEIYKDDKEIGKVCIAEDLTIFETVAKINAFLFNETVSWETNRAEVADFTSQDEMENWVYEELCHAEGPFSMIVCKEFMPGVWRITGETKADDPDEREAVDMYVRIVPGA